MVLTWIAAIVALFTGYVIKQFIAMLTSPLYKVSQIFQGVFTFSLSINCVVLTILHNDMAKIYYILYTASNTTVIGMQNLNRNMLFTSTYSCPQMSYE